MNYMRRILIFFCISSAIGLNCYFFLKKARYRAKNLEAAGSFRYTVLRGSFDGFLGEWIISKRKAEGKRNDKRGKEKEY